MSTTCQHLPWDSDFFGYPVARLGSDDGAVLDARRLTEGISSDVRLAYYSSATPLNDVLIEGWEISMVDRKTTFVKDIHSTALTADFIRPFDDDVLHEERLMQLAIQSGLYSRFNVDERIGKENFERMYSLWMQNSLRKQIAFEVLISETEGEVSGFVTLGEKNGRGDIGIIAVDIHFRGRGIGKALMLAAEHAFAGMGYSTAQVVTQGANIPAIKLYESCGYTVDTVEYYYHLWRQ